MPTISILNRVFVLMWVVYDHPKDYPDSYVARLWMVGPDDRLTPVGVAGVAPTLDGIRSLVPPQADTWVVRDPLDDPVILGSWI